MLNTTIKPFQKFPMWLKHPDQKPGNAWQPVIVHNEEEAKDQLARGYVAPEIDEKAWLDSQFQIHLAKQMIAIMTGSERALKYCMEVQYRQGQLETELEILKQRPNEIDQRIDNTELRLRASVRRIQGDLDRLKARLKSVSKKKKPAAKARKVKA